MLDLLSTIGTWLSFGLALIALFGVLPVFFLYRQARTDRYRAITNVHDPHNFFISPGIPLLPGKRFFRKVRVPNLANPPNVKTIEIKRQGRQVFKLDTHRSSTGWVNFANILRAYGLSFESSGELEIHHSKSFLPVHRAWILLFGIIDRYAHRVDYGLFRDESKEQEMDDFGRSPLCGLSGFMAYNPPTWHEDLQGHNGSICFQMHSIPHMNYTDELTGIDTIPFQKMLLLYLGYIPREDNLWNTVYFIGLQEQPSHRKMYGRIGISVWQVGLGRGNLISYNHEIIMRDLGLDPPKVYRLECVTEDWETSFDDTKYYALQANEYVNRTDIHLILKSILELGSSSQSLLYNKHSRNGTPLVEKVFVPHGLEKFSTDLMNLLRLSTRMVDLLSSGNKQALLRAITAVAELCQIPIVAWSRELLKRYYELEVQLRQYCEANRFAMQTISILYMLDESFRSLYACPEEQNVQQCTVSLRPANGIVEISSQDPKIS